MIDEGYICSEILNVTDWLVGHHLLKVISIQNVTLDSVRKPYCLNAFVIQCLFTDLVFERLLNWTVSICIKDPDVLTKRVIVLHR